MASPSKPGPAVEPVVAGEIIILDPAEITIGERLRAIDPVHAESLGWSIRSDGQIHPIEVCRLPGQAGWHLAGPGGHRLTGALIVGLDGIEARVVSASRTSRRRREAVENLFRRNLDPIARAEHIAELVELKRAEAGVDAARRAASVRSDLKRDVREETAATLETISNVYGWSEELGAELGFTGRTIRNDLLLFRSLLPSLVAQLREARHPILSNASQLRGLAKLAEPAQRAAVTALVGGARTVADATKGSTNRPVDPEAKRLSAFIGAFSRMGLAEKKAALFQLQGMLPAGVRLEVGK